MAFQEFDYNQQFDMSALLQIEQSKKSCLSDLSKGIDLLKEMQKVWKEDPNAKLIFSYTSNVVSSGLREILRFMCEHRLVDCVVTSCGGIEEDFIKCQNHFYKGKFFNDDYMLRMNGINWTGNMYVPNKNYVDFEEFLNPIISSIAKQSKKEGKIFTSSDVIMRMAQKINNEESIYYHCYKNNIPVFCPGIVDGSIGDVMFFLSYKYWDFKLDVMRDHFELNDFVWKSSKCFAFILGGGFIKHWVLQAGQYKQGFDSVLLINDGLNHDQSDAGKSIEQEIERGYLKDEKKHIKVFAEISLVLPIVISQII